MADELDCPKCGEPIPPTGMSSKVGTGTGGGEVAWQPERSHTECPKCGTKLVRLAGDPTAPWKLADS